MKKTLLTALLVVISICLTLAVAAEDNTYGNLNWSFEEGKLTIWGKGAMKDFVSDGYFDGSWRDSDIISNITSIEIQEGVTTIGNYAFHSLRSCEKVTLPQSLTYIGSFAFSRCQSLMNIVLPGNIMTIGEYAFSTCDSLSYINIPLKLTTISRYAFSYCSALKQVDFPDKLSTIGDYAFVNCTSLSCVTFSSEISSISKSAFNGCDKLLFLRRPEYKACCFSGGQLILLGDVNNSKEIEASDAVCAARYIAGYDMSNEVYYPEAMDVDMDHEITPRDVMILSRCIAGWTGYTVLPYGLS